jgi:hypothetical protein
MPPDKRVLLGVDVYTWWNLDDGCGKVWFKLNLLQIRSGAVMYPMRLSPRNEVGKSCSPFEVTLAAVDRKLVDSC